MMSTSEAGRGLNMDEFSYMSKRLAERETMRGRWGELDAASTPWQLSASSYFTALAADSNRRAQHLLWPAQRLLILKT